MSARPSVVAVCLLLFSAANLPAAEAEKPILEPGETVYAQVVDVPDGDLLSILIGMSRHDVVLAGIDAPESGQPSAERARQILAEKVGGKTVRILAQGQDRFGRILGIVWADTRNVNRELVAEGLAWYRRDVAPSAILAKAEDDARKQKLGLWADPQPIPPWLWRQKPPAALVDPFLDLPEAEPAAKPGAEKKQPAAKSRPQRQPPAADTPAPPQALVAGKYWLTASSNTRHNPKCRYYQKSKGRFCGPNEGKPCGTCGG